MSTQMASPPTTPEACLQTVQAVYAAFGSGDLPRLLGLLDEAVDWRFLGSPGMDYNQPAQGRAGVARWFDQVLSREDIKSFEPREFLPGAGHVTVIGHEGTLDRVTGRSFETPWLHVWQCATGADGSVRITRFLGLYDSAVVHLARHGL